MPVRINKNINLKKNLRKAKPRFQKQVKKGIKGAILNEMKDGESPVAGGGKNPSNTGGRRKYKAYSKSYKRKIEKGQVKGKTKTSPPNLKATGKLHRSLKVRALVSGGVRVFFSSPIAKYHDKLGAGKSKIIRRLIPKTGESFARSIREKIVSSARLALREFLD